MAKGGSADSSDSAASSGSAVPDPSALGYEEARAALAEVVAALEAGNVTLEEALSLWERGEEYAAACERWLEGAQARLDEGVDAAEDVREDSDRA